MKPTVEELEPREVPCGPPNVILIVTDDQRSDSMQYMPLTQGIFAKGTQFTNAYVTTPLCCPSRASILTGQYARNHGVIDNHHAGRLDESHTLATMLHRAGYLTGFIGKYLNGYSGTRIPAGWDQWHAYSGLDHGGYYDYTLNNNGTLRDYGSGPADYSTRTFRDQGLRFITDHADDARPWFLEWAPRAPHAPSTPAPRHEGLPVALDPLPPSFNEQDVSDKPAYVRDISPRSAERADRQTRRDQRAIRSLMAVDEAIQSLYDAVVAAGELEDTVWIFVSDNGLFRGEHRLDAKTMPYEEAIHVPLLIRGPGVLPSTRSELVLNIDIAPTILDYAGLAPDPLADGVSFRPSASGQPAGWRQDFLIESFVDSAARPAYRGVHGTDWVYIEYGTGEREYYDLAADPFQLTNRINDPTYADAVTSAALRLAEF
jgi:N-acetylglucosamine-6-sulfatase